MTNDQLVRDLIQNGFITSEKVKNAFLAIDRKDFIPYENEELAYFDIPIEIGYGQTISQPSVVAFMLEKLDVYLGELVLDVGSGSGYTTALLSNLVGPEGFVYGSEIIKELADFGDSNLRKYRIENAEIFFTEPYQLGLPHMAPFDKILVSASTDEIPQTLLDQLKIGGNMIIPIDNGITRVFKTDSENIESDEYPGFFFVPLIEHEKRNFE